MDQQIISDDQLPLVSVVIPTLNRVDYLKNCLASLIEMNYPKAKFEIVVVDNGCTDGTAQMVQQDFPEIELIREKRKGVVFARNTGSKRAKGAIVAYTDDDCIVDKDWIRNLVCGFVSGEIGGVGGPVFHLRPEIVPERLWCDRTRPLDLGNRKHFVKALITGNMAVRREVFGKIRFDETLIFHQAEDIDFSRSLTDAGYKLVYTPDAVVYHDVDQRRSTMHYIIERAFFAGISKSTLDKKRAHGTLSSRPMRAFLGATFSFLRKRRVADFYWFVECFVALISFMFLMFAKRG